MPGSSVHGEIKGGLKGVSWGGGEADLQKVRDKGNISQRTYCQSKGVEVGQGLSKDAMLTRGGGAFWRGNGVGKGS